MLAGLLLAAACAAWHPEVAGYYPGTVLSSGAQQPIDTWIEETSDGRLSGHYVLHEPGRDVPGTLAPLADTGCNTATFQWTDLYGTGLVRLQFFPAARCFEGVWGGATDQPQLPWHACIRERVTS